MITVLGADGFIGSHLVEMLSKRGADFFAPDRDQPLLGQELGDVIYCIGLTADYRSRPFAAVEAHVCHLCDVLQDCRFRSLVYLSSTRIYKNNTGPASEPDTVNLDPSRSEDLYDISKIMGESLTFSCRQNTRVVRLSNVYGKDFGSENFLPAIIRESVMKQNLEIGIAAESAKDYVSIDDVVETLIKIAETGKRTIYNLASGANTSNRELAKIIGGLTGCTITFDPAAAKTTFPAIDIDRVRSEFGFHPRNVLDELPELVASYKRHYQEQGRRGDDEDLRANRQR
jgi:nucleoside-diphosphate-sugar epimerase